MICSHWCLSSSFVCCLLSPAILLGSVKVPYEEMKRRILEMDEENLTVGLMEQLIKYLPKPEHTKKLEALRAEYQSLAEPEQFAVVVSILLLTKKL